MADHAAKIQEEEKDMTNANIVHLGTPLGRQGLAERAMDVLMGVVQPSEQNALSLARDVLSTLLLPRARSYKTAFEWVAEATSPGREGRWIEHVLVQDVRLLGKTRRVAAATDGMRLHVALSDLESGIYRRDGARSDLATWGPGWDQIASITDLCDIRESLPDSKPEHLLLGRDPWSQFQVFAYRAGGEVRAAGALSDGGPAFQMRYIVSTVLARVRGEDDTFVRVWLPREDKPLLGVTASRLFLVMPLRMPNEY